MQELEPEDWDQLIETNLTGSFNILTPALKRMREKQKGLIILINSVAGRRATPLAGIACNCSKFGMTALGIGAGEEEKENGIRWLFSLIQYIRVNFTWVNIGYPNAIFFFLFSGTNT
jgi:NAD(P)-dependent dehydrogenase (short-subunit alcohol dehydrogenase family)